MRSWLNPVMNWSAPNSFFVDTDEYGRCIKNAGLRMPKKLLIIFPCVHIHKPEQQFSKQIGSAACSSCLYFSNKTAMLAYARILTAVAWYFLFVFSLNSEKSFFSSRGVAPRCLDCKVCCWSLAIFFFRGFAPISTNRFFFPRVFAPAFCNWFFSSGLRPEISGCCKLGNETAAAG